MSLDGAGSLVVGGSSGIGFAVAQAALAEGAAGANASPRLIVVAPLGGRPGEALGRVGIPGARPTTTPTTASGKTNIKAILPDGENYSHYAGDYYMRGLICQVSATGD